MAKGLSRQELLSLARAGVEARISELQAQIDTIRATFGGGSLAKASGPRRKKGKLSAAGRANIVAAQKARWAAKKSKGAEAKPKPKAKRKMSKAGRAKIAAAAKARWATWRAKKKSR